MRIGKDAYYLEIAAAVAKRSTCIRRQYGAVIVKNDEIISTGYNGSPRGAPNCCDEGRCWREAHNIPHGEQYEKCVSVHAEQNAIISASRQEMMGADLYLVGFENGERMPPEKVEPCTICARMIKNAGIEKVVTKEGQKMREILFRGKCIGYGWVEGYLNQYRGKNTFDCCGNVVKTGSYYINDWLEKADTGLYGEKYSVAEQSIGEYTGLKDKNGNKIFEGDVLLIRGIYDILGPVEYVKDKSAYLIRDFRTGKFFGIGKDAEITGNIHSGPGAGVIGSEEKDG